MKKRKSLPAIAFIIGSMFSLLALAFLVAGLSSAADAQYASLSSRLSNLSVAKSEMQTAGMGTTRIGDLISEGLANLGDGNYARVSEIIAEAHALRTTAFTAKAALADIDLVYSDALKCNVSLPVSSNISNEMSLNDAREEYDKENFEEAIKIMFEIKAKLIQSIKGSYFYLNQSILEIQSDASMLGLSTYRISTIKSIFDEALANGRIGDLEQIKNELASLSQTLQSYQEVKQFVLQLESQNLSSQRAKDSLSEAEADMNMGNYQSVAESLKSMSVILRKALGLSAEITKLEGQLAEGKSQFSLDVSDSEARLDKAKTALAQGDYTLAEEEFSLAQQGFESQKAQSLMKSAASPVLSMSIPELMEKTWLYMLGGIILLMLIIMLVKKALSHNLSARKLARLEKELKVTHRLVQELQRNYFAHRKMSRENYDTAYESLQDKIISLKEKIFLINKKIKKKV